MSSCVHALAQGFNYHILCFCINCCIMNGACFENDKVLKGTTLPQDLTLIRAVVGSKFSCCFHGSLSLQTASTPNTLYNPNRQPPPGVCTRIKTLLEQETELERSYVAAPPS